MEVTGLVLLGTVAVEGIILCPEIGLLGTPTNLTCTEDSRSHSFITPNETPAASCEISTGKCIPTGNLSASVINTTSSVLTIPALLESLAGRWKCSSDGDILDPPSCLMTVASYLLKGAPESVMESIIRLLLVTSAVTVAVEGRILCPEIGLLGTPTNLTCTEASRSHSFNTPSGTSATACEISTGKCISTGNFSASVINTTSSVLTIPAVLESFAGRWKCSSDGDILDPPSCLMTVAKFPTCTITGRHYGDGDFTVDEEEALKVNVTRYYCSGSVRLLLQTGDIKTDLNSSQRIANTDVIFNLTESHIGEVKLIFICGGYRQTLPCEGIQQLRVGTNFDNDIATRTGVGTNFDNDIATRTDGHCRSISVIAGTVGVVIILINVLAVIICLRRHHVCQSRQPPAGYLSAVYAPGSAASDYGYATVDDVGYASGQYLRPTFDKILDKP